MEVIDMLDDSYTDMVNRDPNNINDHILVDYNDLIAEPVGVRSPNCIWKHSYICFSCWRDVCYKIATFLFSICIAAEWGCEFARVAFVHIWCATPLLKTCEMQCNCYKRAYGECVHCCCDPCCNSFSTCFGAFKRR